MKLNLLKGYSLPLILHLSFCSLAQEKSNTSLSTFQDEVIKRYLEAIGGYSKIKELKSLSYSQGTYSEGDFTGNGKSTMSLARPYYKLVGNKLDPGSYMEGYDGAVWEWFKNPGVVLRTV